MPRRWLISLATLPAFIAWLCPCAPTPSTNAVCCRATPTTVNNTPSACCSDDSDSCSSVPADTDLCTSPIDECCICYCDTPAPAPARPSPAPSKPQRHADHALRAYFTPSIALAVAPWIRPPAIGRLPTPAMARRLAMLCVWTI